MRIDFYEKLNCKMAEYAVIATKYNDEWLFLRQKNLDTWELPSTTITEGEKPYDVASKELKKTGAIDFDLDFVCHYSVSKDHVKTYGKLFFAEIKNLGELENSELAEIKYLKDLPEKLTYDHIHPFLFKKVVERLHKDY